MTARPARRIRGRATLWHIVSAIGMTAAALSLPRAGAAQGEARAPRLVLGQIYADLRASNPRLAATRASARAFSARVSAAGLPPDPEIELGFMNYSLPELAPMDVLGMTQLRVMQMIPTAGKLRLARGASAARADAAAARVMEIEWEMRARAAMTFYDLHAADRSLEVARQTLRLLHDIRQAADAMYRVGEGQQTDVLRAQVEVARMTEDTVRMQAMRTAMAARLNALLDRPAERDVGSPILPAFPDSVPSLESVSALAELRPMLRGGAAELRAAELSERLARREIWPDLQVGVAYAQRSGDMGREHMGSLMLGASLPVFARGRQLRMREEAAAMQLMARADLTAMQAQTRGDVAEAHAMLVRARRLATLYRSTVIPQADVTAASALGAYRAGRVDFMTLLDNRMTVNRYRQELIALEAEEGRAWAELEMLVGRELVDPFATSPDAMNRGPR